MKAFKEVKAGDILFKLCFSDYSVSTLTVHAVGRLMYDNATRIGYNDGTRCFCREAYEEDLDKCWLYDTLSYAICTDYEAIDVAIKENRAIDKAIRKNHKKPKRKKGYDDQCDL